MKPTLYTTQTEPFNQKFDPQTGVETVSLWAPENCKHILTWLPEYEDYKTVAKLWACSWLGRAADANRCTEIGIRVANDGRIEIRLRFGPPWYWDQITNGQLKAQSDSRDSVRCIESTMV